MFDTYIVPSVDIAAILFNGAKRFEEIDNIPSTENPIWNTAKIAQAVSEKTTWFYTCK